MSKSPAAPGDLSIFLNGDPYGLPAGSGLLDLLASLGLDPRIVAVERNGELVRRPDFAQTPVAAGDRFEVVHFVQGG
jgi:sulfur carrier protein